MPIRRLTPADAAAFHELRLRAFREHPSAFTSSWEEARQRPVEESRARLASGSTAFWGAFSDEGVLQGMLGLELLPRAQEKHKGRVVAMYVAPEAARRGVGAQLLEALLAHARSLGLSDLVLTVTLDNGDAERLYRRAGFVAFGTEPRAIRVAGRPYDKVHMHLVLD